MDQNIFWLDDIRALFSTYYIVPQTNTSLNAQLNCFTRLVIILFVICILFNIKSGIYFAIISLLIIIIVYYIQKRKMQTREKYTENYETSPKNVITYNMNNLTTTQGNYTLLQTSEPIPFCNDEAIMDPLCSGAVGMNQKLAGKASDKTLIKPVVVPPSWDLEYWRDNNLINLSIINTPSKQEDMYLSGYAVSNCCDYYPGCLTLKDKHSETPFIKDNQNQSSIDRPSVEMYQPRQIVSPVAVVDRPSVPTVEMYQPRQIVSPVAVVDRPSVPTVEMYENSDLCIKPNQPGWVNRACGYNPQQLYNAGLPTNLVAGNCEQNPRLKQYNQNLFTQTVTPGVYTRNNIVEPINSNIGISFQQQFEPTTIENTENGRLYTQHDPRLVDRVEYCEPSEPRPNYDNVYDPRFYGYGTSYRSYLEPNLGQTRFMYDDVNAIRMPNYITRSKIDHLPYADSYGPVNAGDEYGNKFTNNIRQMAQDSWLQNSLQFRNDLTERRMRKINSESWQKRAMPLGPYMV